jgi:hypothetical protein
MTSRVWESAIPAGSEAPSAIPHPESGDDDRVPSWECPECGRRFARTRQGHECAPAMTLEEYFSTGPERERPIYDAVKAHLDTLGPIHVEPVSVGIFLKRPGSVAQLRPKTKWVDLSVALAAPVRDDPRIVRKPQLWSGRWYHAVRLTGPDDVDDRVREWLTEAYFAAEE